MPRILLALFALASLFCSGLALDIRGKIQWTDACPSLKALGHAKVVLDNGKLQGSVTQDGSFTIPDVAAGTYVLSVLAHDFSFDQLRIDVFVLSADSPASTSLIPLVSPFISGTPLFPASTIQLPYPILLPVRGERNAYYTAPEAFNLVGMFQNPMMLLMVAGGIMMMGMPYIMKNLDPEMLQEVQGRQASIHSSLQNGDIASGLSAIMNSGPEDTAGSSPGKPQTVSKKSGGNKNKRR